MFYFSQPWFSKASTYSAHVYFEPALCRIETISILGYRGTSLDMVTQTHYGIVKMLPHFNEIYQPWAVIGKELGSIHNSTLQFQLFGIDFLSAPIPTPLAELVAQLQLQFHGIGGIPRDSTCFNFPLSIQLSLAVKKY